MRNHNQTQPDAVDAFRDNPFDQLLQRSAQLSEQPQSIAPEFEALLTKKRPTKSRLSRTVQVCECGEKDESVCLPVRTEIVYDDKEET
jgi:hypothetical protein